MTARVFIHGLQSSNKGTKSVYFKDKFPDMIIPHFTGTLQERMAKLNKVLKGRSGIRIVGSSFGGLMGTLFAMENEIRVDMMVLLAPAINLMEYAPERLKRISIPVSIYHGEKDEVIPLKDVEPVARRIFQNLSFHIVDDDHFLHKAFKHIDWDGHLS